jgi:hypothetical protein
MFLDSAPTADQASVLFTLPGTVVVQLAVNEAIGGFTWTDTVHNRQGILSQDDTPIKLEPGREYTARLVPSREDKGGNTTWRLSHLGTKPVAVAETLTPATEAPTEAGTKKPRRGWFSRLFGSH